MTQSRARESAQRRARRLSRLDARRVRLLHPHARHRRRRAGVRHDAPGHRADDHADAGDAPDRRDHLRHDGRPLRPPAAADAQRRSSTRSSRCCRGLAPSYQAFLILRMLFGIGMGGEWGVGASLALESASPRLRGLLSGLLQEGYAIGNLLAALAFRTGLSVRSTRCYPGNGWRVMFFLGGLPALLSLFIRAKVKESEAWHEHRTDWTTYRRRCSQHWPRFLYLVAADDDDEFHVARHAGHVSDAAAAAVGYAETQIADITMLVDDRRDSRRPGLRLLLGPRRPAPRDDDVGALRAASSSRSGSRRPAPRSSLVGVFLMQFFVQGAWGVIPAHINELSPGHLRGFFPGFAYQLGVLCAASIPYIESVLGEHFTYAPVDGRRWRRRSCSSSARRHAPRARGARRHRSARHLRLAAMHRMDLRQLEILQAIAETGSFTACGRKLHVSQSAISRQILAARRGARRAAVSARRPPGADDAGGREPRPARPARVPGRARHGRRDHRSHARAARHAAAVRRHDGVPLRVPAAAEAPAARASAARRPADGGDGRPIGAGDPRRPRRRRAC